MAYQLKKHKFALLVPLLVLLFIIACGTAAPPNLLLWNLSQNLKRNPPLRRRLRALKRRRQRPRQRPCPNKPPSLRRQ
ncbi:MAG TPA: hypothetical protein VFA32_25060 [Dehalococcoidia bacterium]|jgi:hypothetical protein|nr:hypothetical protein [Dehalococcoidia bacterium]